MSLFRQVIADRGGWVERIGVIRMKSMSFRNEVWFIYRSFSVANSVDDTREIIRDEKAPIRHYSYINGPSPLFVTLKPPFSKNLISDYFIPIKFHQHYPIAKGDTPVP